MKAQYLPPHRLSLSFLFIAAWENISSALNFDSYAAATINSHYYFMFSD